ncbi:MAG TPA: hypothetical protein VGD46_13500, partial [Rhizobacter sp.]
IAKRAAGGEVEVERMVRELQAEGQLKFLAEKLEFDFRDSVVNAWQTDWYIFKVGLRCAGYRDASVLTGHFTKGA